MSEVNESRRVNPEGYVKISAFDASTGTESYCVTAPFEGIVFLLLLPHRTCLMLCCVSCVLAL